MILDSSPERAFDDITRLLATALDVPIALVNVLDADRDWFKSRVGLHQTQSPVATSLCEAFFAEATDLIVVEDTQLDPRFNRNPLVTGQPFVRFYAAARLVVDDQTIATLCAYDLKPKTLHAEQLDQLKTLAATAISAFNQRLKATPPP